MIEGIDGALLALALAGIAGGAAVALLGASWLRQRRRRDATRPAPVARRRVAPPGDADPMLASLGLEADDEAPRRDR
jgi:hypothetical protein